MTDLERARAAYLADPPNFPVNDAYTLQLAEADAFTAGWEARDKA